MGERPGSAHQSDLLLREVRELREELKTSLVRLQDSLLQPLCELRESLDAGAGPGWSSQAPPWMSDEATMCSYEGSPGILKGAGAARATGDVRFAVSESAMSSVRDGGSPPAAEPERRVSNASSEASYVGRRKTSGTALYDAQESIKNQLFSREGLHADNDYVLGESRSWFRRVAILLVRRYRTAFESAIGLVILVNSLCIGWEIELSLAAEPNESVEALLEKFEIAFLCVYIVELLLRIAAEGSKVWKNPWFRFDAVLVFVGLANTAATILVSPTEGGAQGGVMDVLEQAPLVRNLRLVRLVRAVRMMELFNDLWKLCVGLMNSVRTVASACVLVSMVGYMFGCLGVELITKSETLAADPKTAAIVDRHFDSVLSTLLTLVQFVTADSIGAIYTPLIRKQPLLAVYFVMLIVIVTVLLMNLVTAAVVESAIRTGKEDREMQRYQIMKRVAYITPQIQRAFKALDISQDGKLDRDELEHLQETTDRMGIQLPRELHPLLQSDKLRDLWACLDKDQDGKIETSEFLEGVCKIALSNVPVETMQMLSLLRQQENHLTEVRTLLNGELNQILKGLKLGHHGHHGHNHHHGSRNYTFPSRPSRPGSPSSQCREPPPLQDTPEGGLGNLDERAPDCGNVVLDDREPEGGNGKGNGSEDWRAALPVDRNLGNFEESDPGEFKGVQPEPVEQEQAEESTSPGVDPHHIAAAAARLLRSKAAATSGRSRVPL